jgi:radical SAM protein with 4Fe4S-binding SPASM domain
MNSPFTAKVAVKDPTPAPYPERMLGLSLTNLCNLNCQMCWQKDRSKKLFLDSAKAIEIVQAISRLAKPPVYLWGGEPLLHPDVWGIVRAVKQEGLFCIMNTNGLLLEKNLEEVFSSGLDMLIVSVDGPEDIHDQVRGCRGAYRRIVEGLGQLGQLRRRRPLVMINCVINELNYRHLESLVELKNRVGADYLEFQFMMFYSQTEKEEYRRFFRGHFAQEPRSVDDFSESMGKIDEVELCMAVERILGYQDNRIRVFPAVLNGAEKNRQYLHDPAEVLPHRCQSIYKALWVEPNGDVGPCSNFPDYVVGNLFQTGIENLWNHERFRLFRAALSEENFSICHRCCDFYKTDIFRRKDI